MMRLVVLFILATLSVRAELDNALFQSLSEKEARSIVTSARVNGRVGGAFDFRVTSTDRSFNYKLRATWITERVASALARELVTARGISQERVFEAFRAIDRDHHYFLVELDPREGSGVIPKDWVARLESSAKPSRVVIGEPLPETDQWSLVLKGFPRDYAYDVFLMRFPRRASNAEVLEIDSGLELVVGIYNKVGRVRWPAPRSSR